jgi:hypothetical protein
MGRAGQTKSCQANGSVQQLESRPVGVPGGDEAGGFRAEHELVKHAIRAAHRQAAAFVLECHHGADLRAAPEVLDAGTRPKPWKRSRGSQHNPRVVGDRQGVPSA